METTNNDQKVNLLETREFINLVKVGGNLYWEGKCHAYNILRLPVKLREMYPQIQQQKIRYELLCFPDQQSLIEYIKATSDVPLLLFLFERQNKLKLPKP